jgi:RNA polymerase sigma-70 factor (ECF subfamily)
VKTQSVASLERSVLRCLISLALLLSRGYDPDVRFHPANTRRGRARRASGQRAALGLEALVTMHTTSPSLLERLRQPADQTAWDRLVELYTPLLYYWARRMGLQEPDAADLVQEVFTVLVQKLPQFTYDKQKSFRGWLRTVTLHKWGEKQRRAGVRREAEAAPLPDVADPHSPDAAWEAEYHQHIVRRALEIMQSEFQSRTWKACWETVVAGRSAEDVAAELGLSAGAVRAAKFRVLCRLREELAGLID